MFNTELLADVMLLLMVLAIVVALCAVAWATIVALRKRGGGVAKTENRVPARRIVVATLVGTLLLVLLTFLLGSSAPMSINGKTFADGFWLRAADMFIVTSGILLLAGGIVYAYSELRNKK